MRDEKYLELWIIFTADCFLIHVENEKSSQVYCQILSTPWILNCTAIFGEFNFSTWERMRNCYSNFKWKLKLSLYFFRIYYRNFINGKTDSEYPFQSPRTFLYRNNETVVRNREYVNIFKIFYPLEGVHKKKDFLKVPPLESALCRIKIIRFEGLKEEKRKKKERWYL